MLVHKTYIYRHPWLFLLLYNELKLTTWQ